MLAWNLLYNTTSHQQFVKNVLEAWKSISINQSEKWWDKSMRKNSRRCRAAQPGGAQETASRASRRGVAASDLRLGWSVDPLDNRLTAVAKTPLLLSYSSTSFSLLPLASLLRALSLLPFLCRARPRGCCRRRSPPPTTTTTTTRLCPDERKALRSRQVE